MFSAGEIVFDKSSQNKVQILSRTEVWDYVTYKVYNIVTNQIYKIAEDQLQKDAVSKECDEHYLRYVCLQAKLKNEISDGRISSVSNKVIPLPHQAHVLKRAMETKDVRYILADEVGLGKTIEAGLIIKELKARGLVKRTLVVCPTGLVTQWASEMKEKFNEIFNIVQPSDYDTIKHLTGNNDVYGQFDQVISPMDSIKPLVKHSGWDEEKIQQYNDERIYAIINGGWDLIIIDEAHRVAGSSGEVARYKLGSMLSKASPYLLLLSATPHNGKTEPFLRLVRLLDEDAFPNTNSIVKEQVAPYLIRTEKREAIDNYGNKLFKKRFTHLIALEWEKKHSLQKQTYELISSYVSTTYNKALRHKDKNMCLIFLLVIMQRMVTSSTSAVLQSLEKRLQVLEEQRTKIHNLTENDIAELDIEDGFEDAIEAMSLDVDSELQELQLIISTAKQAMFQHPDVKVEKLLDLIDKLQFENKSGKIIIFTEFVATQKYLQDILLKRGYSVSILNGSMDISERNEAMKTFKEKSSIFISTDAGGEGLNLQFANTIINYDLPWNPMKIEQRCGRVDRIGQNDDVHIYNFIIEDTVENRLREVLEEKLSVILTEMGVDKYSDVLDSASMEYDFTDAYLASINNPNSIKDNIKAIERDIKEQLGNAKKYKNIISEEKDLKELVGKQSNFDVQTTISNMLKNYDLWKKTEAKLIYTDDINSLDVKKHLDEEIIFDLKSPVLSVTIKDYPNEEGYFMLWEVSVTDSSQDKKIIPIFINKDFVLRPMSGSKVFDVLTNENYLIKTNQISMPEIEIFEKLKKLSLDFAYNTFSELKERHLLQSRKNYEKYTYALKLREEAAEHIGIENIKNARLLKLQDEKKKIEKDFEESSKFFPDFNLLIFIKLEA